MAHSAGDCERAEKILSMSMAEIIECAKAEVGKWPKWMQDSCKEIARHLEESRPTGDADGQ
jgi:hypothetical protein